MEPYTYFGRKFAHWQSRKAARVICQEFVFDNVLEVGANAGVLTDELSRLSGAHVTGVDTSPDRGKHILYGNAHSLEFTSKQFDLVVCSNTLEHLVSPGLALSSMREVGKQLWLSWTPYWSPFGGHDYAPLHYLGVTRGRYSQLGHNLFKTTVKQTLQDVETAGWKITKVRPRYWPSQRWVTGCRWTREWLSWNVEVHAT